VTEYANEASRASSVHHVVFAVSQEQLPDAAQFFSDLGFRFQTIELEDVGLRVLLDWDGGLELVTPLSGGTDGTGEVAQFLQRNGSGVYSVVIRVADAQGASRWRGDTVRRLGSTSTVAVTDSSSTRSRSRCSDSR
jgi:4-hydroxyphenylpyruvate dioxygenase-like putative hemolysin